MEVKINKEIRDYTESVYFGLSLRQFVFSVLACIIAVILYFIFKPLFGIEILSWICIIGAVPFAAVGFIKYNGMTFEKFIYAFIKSVILTPKVLPVKPTTYYYELCKESVGDKRNVKKFKKSLQKR